MFVKSCSFRALKYKFRVKLDIFYRRKSSFKDITGNDVYAASRSSVDLLDDAIIHMIGENNNVGSLLSTVVESDPDCYFARILLLLENFKHGLWRAGAAAQHFSFLENRLKDGQLSSREGYYAAAALACYTGQMSIAGLLLESAMLDTTSDPLAMRLAQHMYLLIGSRSNVLGCVIRHSPSLDSHHHLYGFQLGMLSTGYVETGRTAIAEEVASKAVSFTKGDSICALHSLLNCFQLQGRTSEVLATLGEYESKHEGTGLTTLLFNSGIAHVMRGNYTGACKVVDRIMEIIADDTIPSDLHLENASILLWSLSMNTRDANPTLFKPMWISLCPRLQSSAASGGLGPICRAMALSFASCTSEEPTKQLGLHEGVSDQLHLRNPRDSESESEYGGSLTSFWKQLTTGANSSSSIASGNSDTIGQAPDSNTTTSAAFTARLGLVEDHINERYGAADEMSIWTVEHAQKALAEHLAALRLRTTANSATAYSEEAEHVIEAANAEAPTTETLDYPHLRAIRSRLPIVLGAAAGLPELVRRETEHFCSGISSFATGDFAAASMNLLNATRRVTALGGGAAKLDILQQTTVEALYRDGQLDLATLLLNERSMLVPQDAQCWRRLSAVLGQKGDLASAQRAHYTAWQLGIGQGGFGGAV